MTMIFIPSLHRLGEFNVIEGLTEEEAFDYARDFTNRVINSRKCFNVLDNDEKFDIEYYYNVFPADYPQEYLDELKARFTYSKNRGRSGYRCLFVGDDVNDVVAVGTTVVYNENRACLNFSDEDNMATLLAIREKYDNIVKAPVLDGTSAVVPDAYTLHSFQAPISLTKVPDSINYDSIVTTKPEQISETIKLPEKSSDNLFSRIFKAIVGN